MKRTLLNASLLFVLGAAAGAAWLVLTLDRKLLNTINLGPAISPEEARDKGML